jgi:hypothetical protein
MPETDAATARAWAEKMQSAWKLNLVWPETEQHIGIDIGFTVDALVPGDADAEAVLNKRLESFERKW